MCFEELGPAFVKLGQLLATRPDLVPEEFVEEFSRLQADVKPLPFEAVKQVLEEDLEASLDDLFASIDPTPLGSASIAQVHRAKLKSGEDVVVKVQRPGLIETINKDLGVLYTLAGLLDEYVPETRPFNPKGIVDEFFKTLSLETNFIVEANNIRRFQENFRSDPDLAIPHVYMELTSERVLTLEAFDGIRLSSPGDVRQMGVDPEEIIRTGLRIYLKMVFNDGLFHGDLHAGNFFILPNKRIGLIDFGVVGRLNRRTQTAIAGMLLALKNEDYERLAYEYVDLAPYNEKVNVDFFAKELRDLVAPYYGLTLDKVNLGKIMMSSSTVAARHGIQVPAELVLFFRSLIAMEGLGRRIKDDFDFLYYALDIATELIRSKLTTKNLASDAGEWLRDTGFLVRTLPRQLRQWLRRVNSPDYTSRIKIEDFQQLTRAIDRAGTRLSNSLLVFVLVICGTYLWVAGVGPTPQGTPVIPLVFYGLAAFRYLFR